MLFRSTPLQWAGRGEVAQSIGVFPLHTLTILYWAFVALTCGSIAYCLIACYGAVRFLALNRAVPLRPGQAYQPPVSMLKPVYGTDRDLEANLRSFFLQDYPAFEILFSARDASDPAVAVVRKLQQEFPLVPSRVLLLGPPIYLNAKVHGMEAKIGRAHV